jgi:hypothetical protein
LFKSVLALLSQVPARYIIANHGSDARGADVCAIRAIYCERLNAWAVGVFYYRPGVGCIHRLSHLRKQLFFMDLKAEIQISN